MKTHQQVEKTNSNTHDQSSSCSSESRQDITQLKNDEFSMASVEAIGGEGIVQGKHSAVSQSYGASQPAQDKTANKNALPSRLKSGIENLSGYSMSDVNVHYNSPKPAQLQAHAYAQGNDIHLGRNQEKHLPHEAWHVVQQKQGRVKATTQMKGIGVNDNTALEKEADIMGAKALTMATASPQQSGVLVKNTSINAQASNLPAQLMLNNTTDREKLAVAVEMAARMLNLQYKSAPPPYKGQLDEVLAGLADLTTESPPQRGKDCYALIRKTKKISKMSVEKAAQEVVNKIITSKTGKTPKIWKSGIGKKVGLNKQPDVMPKHQEIVFWKESPLNLVTAKKKMGGKKPVVGKQGLVGDCWLISSIAAIGLHNPSGLTDMVENILSNGKIKVTLHEVHPVERVPTGNTKDIIIDSKLPHRLTGDLMQNESLLYAGKGMKKSEVEVAKLFGFIEKAVAIQLGGGYKGAQSKNPKFALPLLTGKKAYNILLPAAGDEKPKLAKLKANWGAWGIIGSTLSLTRAHKVSPSKKFADRQEHAIVLRKIDSNGAATVFDQGTGQQFIISFDELCDPKFKATVTVENKKKTTKVTYKYTGLIEVVFAGSNVPPAPWV